MITRKYVACKKGQWTMVKKVSIAGSTLPGPVPVICIPSLQVSYEDSDKMLLCAKIDYLFLAMEERDNSAVERRNGVWYCLYCNSPLDNCSRECPRNTFPTVC